MVIETYPRYIVKTLFPDLKIPSKTKAPEEYVSAVWSRLQNIGYRSEEDERLTVDMVDALICAIVGEHELARSGDTPARVGQPPEADEAQAVLREGYIYGIRASGGPITAREGVLA
jgi:hypothetical protein